MTSQWSEFVFPGRKAKVKVKDDIISAEVENATLCLNSRLTVYTITQLQRLMLESLAQVLQFNVNLETCYCNSLSASASL